MIKKYLLGIMMHKIYGAPELCTVMYETTISNPSSRISHNKMRCPSIQESVYNWTDSNDKRKKNHETFFSTKFLFIPH